VAGSGTIVLGVGLVAVGGWWWLRRKQQQAAQQPKDPRSDCEKACDLLAPAVGTALGAQGDNSDAEHAACKAGCGLVDILGGLFTTDADYQANEKAAIARNHEINGDTEIRMTEAALRSGLQGDTLRFKNGCQPFEGAYGWQFCGKGTADMWRANFSCNDDNEHICKHPRGRDNDPVRTAAARLSPDDPFPPGDEQWTPTLVGSGSFDPAAPDPTTSGPYSATVANADQGDPEAWKGDLVWLVAGVPVRCPHGTAPARADATHFAWPADVNFRCDPVGAQHVSVGGGVFAVDGFAHH
jgi:hypothetical protein